jgi:hypothetical protein
MAANTTTCATQPPASSPWLTRVRNARASCGLAPATDGAADAQDLFPPPTHLSPAREVLPQPHTYRRNELHLTDRCKQAAATRSPCKTQARRPPPRARCLGRQRRTGDRQAHLHTRSSTDKQGSGHQDPDARVKVMHGVARHALPAAGPTGCPRTKRESQAATYLTSCWRSAAACLSASRSRVCCTEKRAGHKIPCNPARCHGSAEPRVKPCYAMPC